MDDSQIEKTEPLTKEDIMKEIGQKLAERRNMRRLSPDAVSRAIKIRITYLEAMEKGEWDRLPGEVYVRGFLVRYAQYLNLDGVHLMAPYFKILSEKKNKEITPDFKGDEPTRSVWIWVGAGILLLVGAMKLFWPQRPSTYPLFHPADVPAPPGDATDVKTGNPQSPLQEHQLEIYSPFPLWLRVKTDKKAFEGFITQNTTWAWKSDGLFEIKLGHTKQVALWFDKNSILLQENQKSLKLPHEN
ncbi:MAG: helix-turn-helix domain-containing protein [Elusimicrobia bacterium]|nr:helix-turn-helix domain-containing protein [Candidatus Obscuribacterium magneticum]